MDKHAPMQNPNYDYLMSLFDKCNQQEEIKHFQEKQVTPQIN